MSNEFTPRPYQSYAIKKIVDNPAIALLLDMGLGKTVITLTAILELKYDRFAINKTLVIAPLRVADATWDAEVKNWKHLHLLRVSKVLGSKNDRIGALSKDADVYVINRENVPWLVEYYGARWPFDMVVIDESSSFKNPQSKRFRALRKVRPLITRIVELSGTPAPNGLMDLWSQIYLLDKGQRLGKTLTSYRQEYFSPGWSNGYVVYEWKLRPGAEERIYEAIDDIAVSMKSEDYLSLPEVVYNRVPVKLDPETLERYKELEKDMVLEVGDSELVATSAAALSGKLLQMANGAIYNEDGEVIHLHDAKTEALKELVETNEPRSIMVFYWYRHDLERLQKAFPKARTLKTAADIKAWNAGKIPLLLVHPASAGHGLNLQYGGSIVVWYGLTWSLELYLQANKRLHRSGQTSTVIIHHLVAEGTIDEAVMKALAEKDCSQARMLEAVKARIKEYANVKR